MKDIKNNFYKGILKATSSYGVFQLLRVVIRLITGKVSALFLGPAGIGYVGFIENTLSLIGSFTGFGIQITGVREIASSTTNEEDALKVSILKKASLFSGILGGVVLLLLSPWLSKLVFNTYTKFYYFCFLSVYFILFNIANTNNIILQGKRHIKLLLVSNFISTLFIAVLSYGLYYTLHANAVIPVFVLTASIGAFTSTFAIKRLKINTLPLSLNELIQHCQPLIKTGFLLTINVAFGQICYYILRLFLKNQAVSTTILGYYEVANVFLISYLGLVFTAMSSDFYPKLTILKDDIAAFNALINQQIQIAILVVSPLIIGFYVFQEKIIILLYTQAFLPVLEIVAIGLLSIFLKAIIWPLGFIPLAKNDNKEYFIQNLIGDFLNVFLSILGFNQFGLKGLGLAILVNFLFFLCYTIFIARKKYQFEFASKTVKIILFYLILISSTYISFYILDFKILAIFMLLFSSIVSFLIVYFQLNKTH